MSQIHYEEIPLEEIVQTCQLVAVVRPLDPPSTTEEIPVPQPERKAGEALPPFIKVTLHYQVEEVLLNDSDRPCEAGQILDVRRSNWRDELRAHIDYYVHGLSESPIYLQYVGGHDGQEVPFIAFLTCEGDGWRFAVDGAVEAVGARPDVLEAIRTREPVLQPTATPMPEPTARRRPGFWARLFGRKG